jgi:alcohol dehydrogenase (NADP+)
MAGKAPFPAPDGVDPSRVPFRTLVGGDRIPALGMGTFGSDHVTPLEVAEAVGHALAMGYRHLDCASVYGNEAEIGRVLQEHFASGLLKRSDLWVTSKLWNDMHGEGDVLVSCARTLKDLGLDYLDLYLVHWPFPNYHPPGCSIDSRSPDARPYIHDHFMRTWRQMERLVESGLVRHIGTSNMSIAKLKLLLRDCRIKPSCSEMELHPHFQQPGLYRFTGESGIVPIGYSPVGSPARPERDRSPDDSVDVEDPVILAAARRLEVHPAVVCLKWGLQRGEVVIPFSSKRRNLLANIRGITGPPLSPEEMEEIGRIDRNCRLIKGQVFLWKENQSWEDLWDPDGIIPD